MYKLSEAGEAIENNDLNATTNWIKNVNSAFTMALIFHSWLPVILI